MINLNQATVEELREIKGIGRVTAEKIVDYRTSEGGFDSVEELINVSGIGKKSLVQVKDKLTVDSDSKENSEKVEVRFDPRDYGLGEIGEVHLVGEMNDWDPADKSYSLEKEGEIWKNKFNLEAGTEYKIMYDSESWEEGRDIGNFDGSNLKV